MHLVLMWRDKIPAGWKPIRKGADPRIACEIPVTFGDESADRSLSEQSVLVRGHSAVVVNNLQTAGPGRRPTAASGRAVLPAAVGPAWQRPAGIERFAWDPETKTCDVVWSNPDVAIPNGIPTMSAATNMIYGIGARDGVWTLEGLDWDTGEVALTVETTAFPTSNSFYAATTIGPGGTVWTGNFGGVTRFQPCDPEQEADCGRRLDPAEAVVGTVPTRARGRTAGHRRPARRPVHRSGAEASGLSGPRRVRGCRVGGTATARPRRRRRGSPRGRSLPARGSR